MARVIFLHAPEAYSIVAIQAVVVLLIIWMFLALDLIILPKKKPLSFILTVLGGNWHLFLFNQ